MPIRIFLKTYLKIFIPIASPFLILSLCLFGFPINRALILYGYCFSILLSLFITVNLREVRLIVRFKDRRQYLKNLTELLGDLGYTLTCQEGLLTTFKPLDPFLVSKEIKVYLFKDAALILTPKRYFSYLQGGPQKRRSLLLRYFA